MHLPRLLHRRLRLLQPKPHVLLAEQRRRGSEIFLSLLPVSRSPAQPTKAEVAAG